MSTLILRPGALALADLRRLWTTPLALSLDAGARAAVDAAADAVRRIVAAADTLAVYAIVVEAKDDLAVPAVPRADARDIALGGVGSTGNLSTRMIDELRT